MAAADTAPKNSDRESNQGSAVVGFVSAVFAAVTFEPDHQNMAVPSSSCCDGVGDDDVDAAAEDEDNTHDHEDEEEEGDYQTMKDDDNESHVTEPSQE